MFTSFDQFVCRHTCCSREAPSNVQGKPECIREHKAIEEGANNPAEWVPEVALSRLWGCRIRSSPANSPLLPSHEFS